MDTNELDFREFPKMARLTRECVITEKIDGTNAQILIADDFTTMLVGSRTRWITPENDNHGFARWCAEHRDELLQLGPGRHFGEWWGQGIQRNYGLKEKRFSLFNTIRWADRHNYPNNGDGCVLPDKRGFAPGCCYVVPVIYQGTFDTVMVNWALNVLREDGSDAAPGFMKPEGVVVYHVAGNVGFKKTLENDEMPKSLVDKLVKA